MDIYIYVNYVSMKMALEGIIHMNRNPILWQVKSSVYLEVRKHVWLSASDVSKAVDGNDVPMKNIKLKLFECKLGNTTLCLKIRKNQMDISQSKERAKIAQNYGSEREAD